MDRATRGLVMNSIDEETVAQTAMCKDVEQLNSSFSLFVFMRDGPADLLKLNKRQDASQTNQALL